MFNSNPLINIMPTKKEIDFFNEQGYLKIKNVVEDEQINDLGKTVLLLCRKYASDYFHEISENNVFANEHFHDCIIKLKAEKPAIFGAIYDSVQCSVSLQSILLSKKMLDVISSITGQPPKFHSLFHSIIRMDVPNDKKNKLSWHQDFVSSEKVIDHRNGLVSWIPLVKVNSENGSIVVCPTSHNDSNAKNMTVKKRDSGSNSSEYLDVPISIIDRYKRTAIEADPGEVVIMPMTLLHQSGMNTSNSVRFTALGRYYPMVSEDFLPGRRTYVPSTI